MNVIIDAIVVSKPTLEDFLESRDGFLLMLKKKTALNKTK